MVEKEYSHLVKTAKIREDTRGLYHKPRIWMEGEDLEGSETNFSYGFIKEECTVHPKEGAIVHPYDEALFFAGINTDDIFDLGAELSIVLGEEGEKHTFNKPTVVVIPAGTPHGPVTVENIDQPIAHYHVGLAPDYEAEEVEIDSVSSGGSKYGHLIKDLKNHVDDEFKRIMPGLADFVDDRGVLHAREVDFLGPGNADELLWMFGKDLEGMDVNLPWGYYSEPGLWSRDGEPHIHTDCVELLFFAGLNPDDLSSLGAELEIAVGDDRYVFDEPTVVLGKEYVPHCPLITRWVDEPFTHTTIHLKSEWTAEPVE